MVPVTIGLGLININAVIDQLFATHSLDKNLAPAAIVSAFRLYMLPQGVFSVAVATVLFPLLSRHASREDWAGFKHSRERPAPDLLPAPAGERGSGGPRDADRAAPLPARAFPPDRRRSSRRALAAFALGLTFNGTMLMLNRGFFSLQSPWMPTLVAFGNLGVNAVLDAVFYRFGTWGIPLSTSIVNIAGTAALLFFFRRRMGGFGSGDGPTFVLCVLRPPCSRRSRGGHGTPRLGLGRSLPAQVVSLGGGSLLGSRRSRGVPAAGRARARTSAPAPRPGLTAAAGADDESERSRPRGGTAWRVASIARAEGMRSPPWVGVRVAPPLGRP